MTTLEAGNIESLADEISLKSRFISNYKPSLI